MRRNSITVVLALAALLFVSTSPAQQAGTITVPNLIRYGGTLKDASGAPMTAATGVTFAIYKEQDGGAPVWTETQSVTPDAHGQYSVLLGSTTDTGLPSTSSRKKSNAGWACRCRNNLSSRACCW